MYNPTGSPHPITGQARLMAATLCPMDASLLAPDGLRVRRGRDVIKQPEISVVILVMNDTARLEECLARLAEHLPVTRRVELLVLANGTPPAALTVLQQREDIVLIRSRVNHGFGGGCNWAARFARGDRLVFLNDDTQISPGWLEGLSAAMDSSPEVGVVGSRVLLSDGRLQEAGSIIWRDGTTRGIGRGADPTAPEYLFRRTVDYVSFCSAMVRRDAWEAVGGFDERYFPAYYEDADLCLRLRQMGLRTVYAPRSVVHHAESASTALRFRHFLSDRNRHLFATKWAGTLPDHEPAPCVANQQRSIQQALRRSGGQRPALLMIDDCEPDQGLGAGCGRMHDAVVELEKDFDITFIASYLTVDRGQHWLTRRREFTRAWLSDMGIHLRIGDMNYLARGEVQFDAVLLSRPTNFAAFADVLAKQLPRTPLIYDTESLWHRRLLRQAVLARGETARRLRTEAVHFKEVEERAMRSAAMVVCLTEDEAAIARKVRKDSNVAIVPVHMVGARVTTENFADRLPEMLFAASWLAGRDSPNISALRWMVAEVMPLILDAVPWARLLVTGANPPAEVLALESPSVTAMGFVNDLRDLYSRVRVVVCPMLAGAGVKLKVVEALQNGVPTVSTSVGAEGIDTFGLEFLDVADSAEQFAERCITLLRDAHSWSRTRSQIASYLRVRSSPDRSEEAVSWSRVVRAALERCDRD